MVATIAVIAASLLGERGRPEAQAPLPQSVGWEVVIGRCITCHSLEIATQQRQGRAGWEEIVDRMISYGTPLPGEEREIVLRYLVREFNEATAR